MTTDVLRRVAALPNMSMPELKRMWREMYQAEPPPYNKSFLVKRLAFRIQELTFGGLSEATEIRLKILAEEKKGGERAPVPMPTMDRPIVGMRMIREWKGVEHSCTVLEDGFEYQGRRFKSLSAVARAITGTRWNGRIFWGLKRPGAEK